MKRSSIHEFGSDLLELFEARVVAGPDAVALVCGGERLGYGELDARADRLAADLRASGVGPEDVVGVCLGRGVDAVVGLLGVLKAGAAYLPLVPELPADRLAYMVRDAGARVLLTGPAFVGSLPVDGCQVVLYDGESGRDGRVPVKRPVAVRDERSLMYVIYTSGSTGAPKGIAVDWRTIANVVRFDRYRDQYLGDTPVVCLQLASVGFDVSFLEIFATLVRGGRLVLVEEAVRQDTERLLELLAAERIERMYLSPALLAQLAISWSERPLDLALTHVFVSGDTLSLTPQTRAFLASLEGVVLENQYGPSETHHGSSLILSGDPHDWPAAPSIGRPIPGTQIYLLDRHLNLVPPGVPGELYIAGDGLARGYIGQPALTAQRFTADPFRPGHRMYRTGDLARWTTEGHLTYLGRTDDQIKIRGFRIEPGEIETALTSHPDVHDAAVAVYEDPPGTRRLAAHVVPTDPERSLDETALRDFLRPRLPAYMLPSAVVRAATLPLTRNGKVDRSALPVPVGSRRLTGTYAPPTDAVQKALVDIWEGLLKVEGISVDDDFFELGGHSLLATQAVSRMRTALNAAVSVRDLFEITTIRRLAEVIGTRTVPGEDAAATVVPREAGDTRLSFAQRRMWFFDQLVPGSSAYNVSEMWHVRGPLDPALLRRALRAVGDRHEVLRTTFDSAGGDPYQVIAPTAGFDWETADLTHLGTGAAHDEAVRLAHAETGRPFDLTSGPLVRAQLFRLGDDHHCFVLHLHHIVVDAWSMDVIWRDLSAFYDAYAAGRPDPLPPLAVQYADYAAWQHSLEDSGRTREQLRFWTELLEGAPALHGLPTDHPRPRALSGRGHRIDFTIPHPTADALRRIGQAHGATPFMVMLTAFDILLARYTGTSDVVTGSPVAGRVRPELEDLVGFFVNTMALRLTWADDPSFVELLERLRGVALGAQENQDVPFDRVVEELAPERDVSRSPVFQIVFALSAADHHASPAGWSVERVSRDAGQTRFDLEMQLQESEEGFAGTVCYSTDLFEPATVRRLTDHFVALCQAVADAPHERVSRLALPVAAERDAFLGGPDDPSADEGAVGHPLELFEARVVAGPDAVALVCGGERLGYGELDARADRLAADLRASGVGPEDVVGVCLGRGVDAVVGLLGVLKAGAAYLPLVPELPADRLAYMVRDAGARVLLTGPAFVGSLPVDGCHVVVYDGESGRDGRVPVKRPVAVRDERSLMYVIYTSGSTGAPKGIAVDWRTIANVVRFDRYRERVHQVAPRSCAQLASHGFDVWLQEAFVTLLRGDRLVLVDEETRRDTERLLELLASERVERMYLSPAQLDQLAISFTERPADLALRHISVGGEPLRMSAETRAFLASLEGVVLENQYGPSETHHGSSLILSGDPHDWPAAPSIGRPIPGTQIYLLDRHLNLVPPGVPGELYIAGDGLARGYIGQPALTAQRFTADPFRPGHRMYRTGDLARWTTEGHLTYLGRTDDQIKIRGFRIEPGEIETALTSHPSVSQAVVVAREDRPGHRRLVAYAVPATSDGIDGAVLRDHTGRLLPDYMVPAECLEIDALPLNANGKVDVRALPDPRPAGPQGQEPRSVREQLLSELFAEVLGVPEVGVHTSFFDLGGHSLLATRLISRVRTTLGVELPVRRLFDSPTVAGLAASLDGSADGARSTSGLETLLPLRTGGTEDPLFCVHPVAGTSWCYAGLPRLIGPGRPVYGLQDPALTDPAHADDRIADLAAHYVERIREVRPHGPYHLLGWSFGGLVAQEMAVRLQSMGEEVGLLCLLDGYPVEGGRDSGRYTPVASGDPEDRAAELRRYAGVSVPLDDKEVAAVHRSMIRNATIMRDFAPKLFRGDLTFVTATREREADAPVWQDWLPFVTGTVTDHQVDCAHLDMMRPEPLARIGTTVARVLAAHTPAATVPSYRGSTG
ncbi:amino acid adenylation domain-containing protein [Streptomyces sp. NBC_01142]|uniref:amino acid adenylation domain-containing protein n=1 Tax=Streptomyces sp. NBC_01142 TaxID=2975865 RepID=UPI00224FBF5E|nr:non-ribosomal peptide synthetase [Streptomyces sp. NBC_01142]MCX4820174.1 amino acid adenylation domain-containing protein [Streptomyces sp. NBC_01142]